MIPSYVGALPTGKETAVAYALDIGGSNLRVLQVSLEGNGGGIWKKSSPDLQLSIPPKSWRKKFRLTYRYWNFWLPLTFQRGQYREGLFDFLAEAVAELTNSGKLGFTFSFPVDQKSLTSGVLLRWTKSNSYLLKVNFFQTLQSLALLERTCVICLTIRFKRWTWICTSQP